MSFLLSLWVPGKRTFTLSILAGILAVLLQGDSQGFIDLAPMIKLIFELGLTLLLPMIPIYLRKGIENARNKNV